jgi:hypothetical protein
MSPAGTDKNAYLFRLSTVWAGIFVYTLIAGLVLQLVILPFVLPSWHAGDGVLKGMDGPKFHAIASGRAERIDTEGWGAWELQPGRQAVAGIASALYALFVPVPAVLLPLNAALNATAAVCMARQALHERRRACWPRYRSCSSLIHAVAYATATNMPCRRLYALVGLGAIGSVRHREWRGPRLARAGVDRGRQPAAGDHQGLHPAGYAAAPAGRCTGTQHNSPPTVEGVATEWLAAAQVGCSLSWNCHDGCSERVVLSSAADRVDRGSSR